MIYKKQIYRLSWLAGLFFVLLGLNSLHQIFSEESHAARADLDAQRNALNKYALKVLKQNLHNRLKFTQFNLSQITQDPLIPSQGLIVIQQGEQILPRPTQYLQQSNNPAIKLYRWIIKIDPLDLVIENASPWAQRLNLLSNFKLAIDSGDSNEIRWGFRTIREHRSQSTLGPELDIPYMLGVIDYFIQKSNPSKRLLQGVIRDGSIIERENNILGLQRSLLNYRNKFTKADFDYLRDRILALSKFVNVTYSDFLQQSELQTQYINIGSISEAAIGLSGKWYVEPVGGEEVLGISIDINEIIQEIHQEMMLLGLITTSDSITLSNKQEDFIELQQIDLIVNSDTWQEKISDITDLYWLKTSLLSFTALLIIIIITLTAIIYYRKQRLLALKSEFISTVSHELKTPLASLRLLAESMNRKDVAQEIISHYPTRIITIIDELHLLIENIFSFNRLNRGDWHSKFENTNIKDELKSVSHEFKQYSQSTGAKPFILEIDPNNFQDSNVRADPELLKILFRNLFSNSIKYNNSDDIVIFISAKITDSYDIVYRDNGIGIPKNQRQEVFTEFSRILSKDKSIAGTGLGLSICRKIMTMHNGSIEIMDSVKPGTAFKMRFPIPDKHINDI